MRPPAAAAVAAAYNVTIGMAVETDSALPIVPLGGRQPGVRRDLVKTREFRTVFHPSTVDDPMWFVQVWDSEGDLVGAAPGEDAVDACLAVAIDIEEALRRRDGD